MRSAIVFATCLTLLASVSARAAGARGAASVGRVQGAAAAKGPHTLVDLRDTEGRLMKRNRLEVILVLDEEAREPVTAQSALNKKMREILALVAKVSDVRAETRGYLTMPSRWAQPGGAITMWRSEETLALTGTQFQDILRLTGRLQKEGLTVRGMEYGVTKDRRRAALKELTSRALRNLRVRAAAAAHDLGLRFLYWSHVAVGEADQIGPRPLMMLAAKAGGVPSTGFPSPVGEAGSATVSVTVNGTAVFGPSP